MIRQGIATWKSSQQIELVPIAWVRRLLAIDTDKGNAPIPRQKQKSASIQGFNRDQKVHYRDHLDCATSPITLKRFVPGLGWMRWRDDAGFDQLRFNPDTLPSTPLEFRQRAAREAANPDI